MPNQEVMREWVSRLRSGKYTQGRGKLSYRKDDEGGGRQHCCLGVLADLAAEKGVTPAPVLIPEGVSAYGMAGIVYRTMGVYNYEGGNTTMPPTCVLEWAGIERGDAALAITPGSELSANRLAYINDEGKTFEQIANLIEETWIDLPEGAEVPDTPAAIDVPEKEPVNA